MLIDWFTVGAQALNFLILVWLMKRFLYKPVLHAIDTREMRIAKDLADAEATRLEARKEREEFRKRNETFDEQHAALMTHSIEEARIERQRMLDEAREDADSLCAKRQKSLALDARNLNQAIARRTQDEVFAIARKALNDLATTSLEDRMAEVFIRRLRELSGDSKHVLALAFKTAAEPALMRSAFDLPAAQREAIQNAVNETFSAEVRIQFMTAPDLISGIELTSNGQKVAWNISGYLASLENGVDEILSGKARLSAQNL